MHSPKSLPATLPEPISSICLTTESVVDGTTVLLTTTILKSPESPRTLDTPRLAAFRARMSILPDESEGVWTQMKMNLASLAGSRASFHAVNAPFLTSLASSFWSDGS